MFSLAKNGYGIGLAVVIGIIAWVASLFTPSYLNSIIIALLFGIIVSNLVNIPTKASEGLNFTSSKLLEFSLLFLAFNIDYKSIAALGGLSFIAVATTVFTVLFATFFLSKKFNCPSASGYLVGFGTAICGSSAIAALSPGIKKEKEDVAISMAVVNLYGTLGMLLLPLLLSNFSLSSAKEGLLIGGSLHSVGNVVGAGYAMGDEVGDASITIKLARVALLTPGIILFNFLVNRSTVSSWKEHFKLPWYLFGFIVISIFVSILPPSEGIVKSMELFGKIALTIAMAAIGLKVRFTTLWSSGKRGILFGFVIFAIQLVILTLFALI